MKKKTTITFSYEELWLLKDYLCPIDGEIDEDFRKLETKVFNKIDSGLKRLGYVKKTERKPYDIFKAYEKSMKEGF